MIRVDRIDLSIELQKDLDVWRDNSNNGIPNKSWKEYSRTSNYKTLKESLRPMCAGKCCYYERLGATHVDHYLPKSPHRDNSNRGSSEYVFLWSNLLLCCVQCNGFEVKGARMKWSDDGIPLLLNPTNPDDDPIGFLDIGVDPRIRDDFGKFSPVSGLDGDERKRAEYTIRLLKLNINEGIALPRSEMILRFLRNLSDLKKLGADFESPQGFTIRRHLIEILKLDAQYLAGIKQLLISNPELQKELVEMIPELTSRVSSICSAASNSR